MTGFTARPNRVVDMGDLSSAAEDFVGGDDRDRVSSSEVSLVDLPELFFTLLLAKETDLE